MSFIAALSAKNDMKYSATQVINLIYLSKTMILNNKIRMARLLLTRNLHKAAMFQENTNIALIPHSEEYLWPKL
jgi:hypothetical protein